MSHLTQTIILTGWAMLALVSCTSAQTTETRDDFKRYYDQFNVEGSFVLYDPQADTYVVYNRLLQRQ
jgi:beta-lactamase class D